MIVYHIEAALTDPFGCPLFPLRWTAGAQTAGGILDLLMTGEHPELPPGCTVRTVRVVVDQADAIGPQQLSLNT